MKKILGTAVAATSAIFAKGNNENNLFLQDNSLAKIDNYSNKRPLQINLTFLHFFLAKKVRAM